MKNTTFYNGVLPFLIAIDCTVYGFDGNDLKILLIKRRIEPNAGKLSLPGSFMLENESLEEGAQRILLDFTGLTNVFLQQFQTFSDINRDPGGRVITVGFYALIKIEESDKELLNNHNAVWYNVTDIPDLVQDHNTIAALALNRIKETAENYPIGFELLPEKFTLPQLQRLYETIFQMTYDKRNFRKKIASWGVLEKLNEKDKSSSKRGAFYHRFNPEKYSELVANGGRTDISRGLISDL